MFTTPHTFTLHIQPYHNQAIMGRKTKGQKTPSFGMAAQKPRGSSKVKRIENYEDTLEEGGVDDCESVAVVS
jgi:hypothetical protein